MDELPDLQDEAQRMMAEARQAFGQDEDLAAAANLQCHPLVVASGYFRNNEPSSSGAVMDFQMGELSESSEPCDPATSIGRRVKRPRSDVDSGDEGDEDISENLHMDPEEPFPSPRSLERYRQLPTHAGASGQRLRKHFHGDGGTD